MFLETLACKVLTVPPQELGCFSEEVVGKVEEHQRHSQEVERHGDGAGVVEECHVNPCQTRRETHHLCLYMNINIRTRNIPGSVVLVVHLLARFQLCDCRIQGRDEKIQDQDGRYYLIHGNGPKRKHAS